ncbi:MAG: hypothetical protein WA118_02915 [Carboxydocellales bacterium]
MKIKNTILIFFVISVMLGGSGCSGSESKQVIKVFSTIVVNSENIKDNILFLDKNDKPTGTIYGIYPGSKGKMKPRWVEKPEDYSHKLKLINQTTGEITASISLQHLVPQSLVVDKNKKGYINHFTNIDLTGDTVSVYDLSSQKLLTTIKTETPSFIATDNQRLYVTNYTTDSLSVFDLKTLKKDKVIPVGKWPKKVILIESTL